MYTSFFNLLELPFNISTDPRFLWLGEKHQEALANLRYGLVEVNGYVVLTGDVGTGKTTLVNALVDMLEENVLVATINHPTLDTVEFFNLVAKSYDPDAPQMTKDGFLLYFKKFLQHTNDKGKAVLLIIDEAHRLSGKLLEEIRLLSNMEHKGKKLINIFFVGQNELKDILLLPEYRALRQRITLFYDIEPLSLKETAEYVAHRLKIAGCDREIFNSAAIRKIHGFTRGYPRLINILCGRALLTGYVKDEKVIDASIVMECVGEISFLDPKAARQKLVLVKKDKKEKQPARQEDSPVAETGAAKTLGQNVAEPAPPPAAPPAAAAKGIRRSSRMSGIIAIFVVALGVIAYIEYPVKNDAKATLEQKEHVALPVREEAVQAKSAKDTAAQAATAAPAEKISAKPAQKSGAEQAPPRDKGGDVAQAPPAAKKPPPVAARPEAEPQKKQERGPSTIELAAAALKQNNFLTALELLEAGPGRAAITDQEGRGIYARALVGRAGELKGASPDQAKALLEKAVAADPQNVEAHADLGRISIRTKDYARAIAAYKQAGILDPQLADAFFNLGFIYATTGMYEDAEKSFARAVALKPSYLDKALFNLAIIQEKLGKGKESLANLQMAVAVRPENEKARDYLKQLVSGVEDAKR